MPDKHTLQPIRISKFPEGTYSGIQRSPTPEDEKTPRRASCAKRVRFSPETKSPVAKKFETFVEIN